MHVNRENGFVLQNGTCHRPSCWHRIVNLRNSERPGSKDQDKYETSHQITAPTTTRIVARRTLRPTARLREKATNVPATTSAQITKLKPSGLGSIIAPRHWGIPADSQSSQQLIGSHSHVQLGCSANAVFARNLLCRKLVREPKNARCRSSLKTPRESFKQLCEV